MNRMSRRPDAEIAVRCDDLSIARTGDADRVVEGVSFTVRAGEALVAFDVAGITVGVATCYDIRFP